jgi:TP901 family phage tail tape measure protein
MAGSIKGILVEIGGDTSGLQKALKKVNSETSGLSKELKGINSLLKLDPKNTELLAQKQTVLTGNIKETEEKLKLLKQAQKEADETIKNGGEISQENYRNLQREIVNTQKKLENLNEEYNNFKTENSKFTKVGKTLQDFGEKVDSTSEKINKIGTDVTAKATTGIVGIATAAVTAGASLESAVDKYIAKAGKSVEETEKYKKVLTDINDANFGEGYEDIANSMAIVEQQMRGLDDAADLENITKKAYYLKDAFDAEINESVRAAKMLMEQWGMSADEAFELINQGYQKGLDKNGDLLDSINEYSVHFRQIGLSATDMFNTFCLGAESGAFSIDKVGDAIKEMGIRLKDGTATDTLKSMKLNANELEKAFAEGGEKGSWAFGEIVKGLQNIKDPLKQNQAGVTIFGTMWEDLGKDAVFSMTSYGEKFDETANTMSSSMDKMYNNTKSSAESSIKRIKTISANLGTKLLPVVNKVLDKVEVFINKLDNLSDSEKDNIINIGLLVAGVGPLIKIVGTAGTVIGTTSKGIGIFSQALSVANNKSTSTSKSVNSLAGFLKGIVSPAGLATIAIGALAAAAVYYNEKTFQSSKAAKEYADSVAQEKKAIEDTFKSIEENASVELNHLDRISKMKDELANLVDENGKVKDGYETRVKFILGELNEALGTEYKMNGNIIESYKELQNNVDKLVAKQKAKIYLQINEEKYQEVVKKQNEALVEQNTAYHKLEDAAKKYGYNVEEVSNKIEENKNKIKELTEAKEWSTEAGKVRMQTEINELKNQNGELESLNNAYKERTDIVRNFADIEKQYNENQKAYAEERYDDIIKYQTATKNYSDSTLQDITNNLRSVAQEYTDYSRSASTADLERAQTLKDTAEKNIQALADELVKRTEIANGELGQQETEAWKALAESNYNIYEAELCKMAPAMAKSIQDATGVIVKETPYAVNQAQSMSQQIIEKLDKNPEFRAKAVSNLQGLLNGMSDENLRNLLNQAGVQDVEKVMQGIRKGNLAENEGINILKSLNTGLQSSSFTGTLFATAKRVAESISSGLEIKPKVSVFSLIPKLPGHKDGLDYVPKDNYVARLHKGERVLTAKENKEYTKMLENIKLPNYSRLQSNLTSKMMNTTNTKNSYNIELKFYPQKMTETELNSAFKYLNRKLGKLY